MDIWEQLDGFLFQFISLCVQSSNNIYRNSKMTRIVEIASPSVARMIAEYRLNQMTKSIRIDQEKAVEMTNHLQDLKKIKESTDEKGKNVDITV